MWFFRSASPEIFRQQGNEIKTLLWFFLAALVLKIYWSHSEHRTSSRTSQRASFFALMSNLWIWHSPLLIHQWATDCRRDCCRTWLVCVLVPAKQKRERIYYTFYFPFSLSKNKLILRRPTCNGGAARRRNDSWLVISQIWCALHLCLLYICTRRAYMLLCPGRLRDGQKDQIWHG